MFRISIALCTFNGSKYLGPQLDSIVSQTRQPDELIICDDRSSDNTAAIANEFSGKIPFNTKVIVNDKTLGPTKNFEKAIRLCTGDLIALSDQDDVWHPQKLENFEKVFENKSTVGAVFSNAEVVDELLNPLGYDMWQKTNFTREEQQRVINDNAIPVLLKHYVVTGATMIFRSDFKPAILPIPPIWFHDAWIAILLASISSLSFIREPMIRYRQHSSNYVGGVKKSIIREVLNASKINRSDYYQLELRRYRTLHDRLLSLSESLNVSRAISLVENKIKHLQVRRCMPQSRLRRIPPIATELMRSGYTLYARNWGSVVMDLFFK